MTDDTTETGTHRVVGKRHHAGGEVHAVGDRYTPTDAELDAFPDRFERVEGDAEPEPADEPAPEPTYESAEAAPYDAEDVERVLGERVEDPQDYNQLRSLATEYDDVPASRISKTDLQVALIDAILAADEGEDTEAGE